MTKQRRRILEALRLGNDHPSAEELYEQVRREMPKISLGTIYRNLEVLTALGEIQTLSFGSSLKRFDGNPRQHYHIRCLQCERLADAPVPVAATIDRLVRSLTDYEVYGHRLEFIGLCPHCRQDR
ncbi:MAG: transcriptional repressor [Desulfobacterales bacterium]|jgi:Fur family ferric uptake transcriptional regulator